MKKGKGKSKAVSPLVPIAERVEGTLELEDVEPPEYGPSVPLARSLPTLPPGVDDFEDPVPGTSAASLQRVDSDRSYRRCLSDDEGSRSRRSSQHDKDKDARHEKSKGRDKSRRSRSRSRERSKDRSKGKL